MELVIINKENLFELDSIMDMIYEEWGRTFSSSKQVKLSKIKQAVLNDEKFPKIYLLKHNNNNIGTFSILEHDLKNSDLSPWLACVVVSKQYRGMGYGSTLLQFINQVIKRSYPIVYLTTEFNGFYEKIGFKFVKLINNNGKNNRLYVKTW